LLNSGQITDTYLLALAKSKQGKLASFDRRLVVDAVVNGKNHFHLIA
jgi:predicted nucleic acid-binding protein